MGKFNDDVKIIATNAKDFEAILKFRDALPEACLEFAKEISGRCLVGDFELKLDVSNNYDHRTIWLPEDANQIHNFGDYIGVYCEDMFIKIYGAGKNHPNYQLVKNNNGKTAS